MLDIYLPILLLHQITYQPVEYAAVCQLQKRILPVVSNFKKNHHDSISEIFHKTKLFHPSMNVYIKCSTVNICLLQCFQIKYKYE